MTNTPFAIRSVLEGKFLGAVTIAFLAQVALLFWLSDRSTVIAPRPIPMPAFRLGDSRPAPVAALEDPTLFVLPHQRGFSGEAWINIPQVDFRSHTWSEQEPLRWLTTPVADLGMAFTRFMENSPAVPFRNLVPVEPTLTFPRLPPAKEVVKTSALRIEGELTGRRLLFCSPMRTWSSGELMTNNVAFLTNNVIQLLVDEQGNVFSAVPLGPGSGYPEADKEALRIANTLRFAALKLEGPDRRTSSESKLMLGTLTFEWQTLPVTNGPIIP